MTFNRAFNMTNHSETIAKCVDEIFKISKSAIADGGSIPVGVIAISSNGGHLPLVNPGLSRSDFAETVALAIKVFRCEAVVTFGEAWMLRELSPEKAMTLEGKSIRANADSVEVVIVSWKSISGLNGTSFAQILRTEASSKLGDVDAITANSVHNMLLDGVFDNETRH